MAASRPIAWSGRKARRTGKGRDRSFPNCPRPHLSKRVKCPLSLFTVRPPVNSERTIQVAAESAIITLFALIVGGGAIVAVIFVMGRIREAFGTLGLLLIFAVGRTIYILSRR